MKTVVRSIRISPDDLEPGEANGLAESRMDRLAPVVAIAGPNGAGKTRLLKRVAVALAPSERRPEIREQLVSQVRKYETLKNRSKDGEWDERLDTQRRRLSLLDSVDLAVSRCRVVELAAAAETLASCADAGSGSMRKAASQSLGTHKPHVLARSALLAMQQVANEYLDATHPGTETSEAAREEKRRRFESLDELTATLLGARFECPGYNAARLLGFPLAELPTKLSPGQCRLLQFAAMLFDPKASDAPLVVLMDEPENHLHATAVIAVLEALNRAFPDCQVWLATHSVPILAHLEPASLWFMRDGAVSYAGGDAEEVLTSLLGGPDNIARVAQFLGRPADMAMLTFAAECLRHPVAVDTPSDDPQLVHVAALLGGDGGELSRRRLVDWGAGTGRLAAMLAELGVPVSYVGYERDETVAMACLEAVCSLLGEDSTVYSRRSDLASAMAGDPADVVVMCNVLHEIPPSEWKRELHDIAQLLKDDGFVLVIEDLQLPHGELAHDRGFVLLDEQGMRILLGDEQERRMRWEPHAQPRYAERLVAYVVPRDLLQRVSANSVSAALTWVSEHSRLLIDDLRSTSKARASDGRRLALALVQYANATIAAEDLG